MKLARKLTLFVMIGATLVLAFYAWLNVRREIRLFETDMLRDHETLGRALAGAAASVWRTDGLDHAKALVDAGSRREDQLKAEWVWLDDEAEIVALGPEQRRRLSSGQEVWIVRRADSGSGVLHTYFPIGQGGPRRAALDISESLGIRDQYVKSSFIHTAITGAAIAAVAFLVTAMVGLSLVGKPVRELVEQARRIGSGDLTRRIEPRRQDELGVLAQEMNSMCDRLSRTQGELAAETAARIAALEQLRHADRLATVGKLASGVAHELGTPLNVISGRAKLTARSPSADETVLENSRIIGEQAERMTHIIRQLLDFARQREPRKSWTQLSRLVSQTLTLLDPLASRRSVKLEMKAAEHLPELQVDSGQVQQVLTNLVANGVHSMRKPGTITVELTLESRTAPADSDRQRHDYVKITVVDQGTGIDPANVDRIFEPFFTTKEVGDGTGLGLSVAYGIVREHQGFIDVETELGVGSRFSVYLPVDST